MPAPSRQRFGDDREPSILERHALRRAAGIPTISVLAGDPTQSNRSCENWFITGLARPVRLDLPDAASISSAYLFGLLAQRDLIADALLQLSQRTGRTVALLRQEWSLRTGPERALWLDRFGLGDGPDDHARLCRSILELPAALTAMETCSSGAELLARLAWEPSRIIAAYARLIPSEELPALVCSWRNDTASGFSLAVAELVALISAVPLLPIVLCVDSALIDCWLGDGDESRVKTFLREGLIRLAAPDQAAAPAMILPHAEVSRESASDASNRACACPSATDGGVLILNRNGHAGSTLTVHC